jgi:hypothetical protein
MEDQMTEPRPVDPATTEVDRRDAHAGSRADRPPTAAEAAKAEEQRLDPAVADAYRDATQHGVDQQGEGRID